MFDPRQRPQGAPQRPGWLQQLGQGLAAQQPMWGQQQPQGGPPPGMRFAPQGGDVPPMAAGPDQRPMAPPGAAFLRDQDAVIRAALARRRQPVPVTGTEAAPQNAVPAQAAPEQAQPDPDEQAARQGLRGYR